MRIYVLTAITAVALPFMALGQQAEPQQTQEQMKETQTTAPKKAKKMRPGQEQTQEQTQPQAKPETGTNVRGQSNVKGRAQEIKKNAPAERSSMNETSVRSTNQTMTVNK